MDQQQVGGQDQPVDPENLRQLQAQLEEYRTLQRHRWRERHQGAASSMLVEGSSPSPSSFQSVGSSPESQSVVCVNSTNSPSRNESVVCVGDSRETPRRRKRRAKLLDGSNASSNSDETGSNKKLRVTPHLAQLVRDDEVEVVVPTSSPVATHPDMEDEEMQRDSDANMLQAELPEESMQVISWNIDGLAEDGVVPRTHEVASIIAMIKPAAVLLQEVTPRTFPILVRRLGQMYDFVEPERNGATASSCGMGYFVVLMFHKEQLKLRRDSADTYWFPRSKFCRHVLTAAASPKGCPNEEIVFCTSHMESLGANGSERIRQLSHSLAQMEKLIGSSPGLSPRDPEVPGVLLLRSSTPATQMVLLGGDLNLRDEEAIAARAAFHEVHDVWEFLGGDRRTWATWDPKTNNNAAALVGAGARSLRFDRVYVMNNTRQEGEVADVEDEDENLDGDVGGAISWWRPISLEFVGKDAVIPFNDTRLMPSDHYGLLLTFRRSWVGDSAQLRNELEAADESSRVAPTAISKRPKRTKQKQ